MTKKKMPQTIDECNAEMEYTQQKIWQYENRNKMPDRFTFWDDRNTGMIKTGAKNLQIMKKIVMSILRLVKDTDPKNAFDIEDYVKRLHHMKVTAGTEADDAFDCGEVEGSAV